MWTVYLQLSFRHFALLKANDEAMQPGFFDVRQGVGWVRASRQGEQTGGADWGSRGRGSGSGARVLPAALPLSPRVPSPSLQTALPSSCLPQCGPCVPPSPPSNSPHAASAVRLALPLLPTSSQPATTAAPRFSPASLQLPAPPQLQPLPPPPHTRTHTTTTTPTPAPLQLPPGYRMDRMEEGDLVEKRVTAPLLRLGSSEVPPAVPEP